MLHETDVDTKYGKTELLYLVDSNTFVGELVAAQDGVDVIQSSGPLRSLTLASFVVHLFNEHVEESCNEASLCNYTFLEN